MSDRPLRQRIARLPVLPPRTREKALIDRYLADLGDDQARADLADVLEVPEVRSLVAGVLHHSPYLSGIMRLEPRALFSILTESPEQRRNRLMSEDLPAALDQPDDTAVASALRQVKAHSALLIALSDIAGAWSLEEVTAALTTFADGAVDGVLTYLLRDLANGGQMDPAAVNGGSGLFVLAMGKHGAAELNYSSDIDLNVFFDPDRGCLRRGKEPQAVFARTTQRLVKILQERTPDGYVFRVDLRLRPDPGTTAVAVSVPAGLHYYETRGQTWERSAYIKARACGGDIAAGEAFLRELTPFVWRKFLDYGAVADIHAMKREINAFRGLETIALDGHNVKLGRGGIREVEFFVQSLQLIAGGRNPRLRGRRTLDMLDVLVDSGWTTPETASDLAAAYRVLRSVEHRLQMVADEQTHTLPRDADAVTAIARFLGHDSRKAFEGALVPHLERVDRAYQALFAGDRTGEVAEGELDLASDPPRPATLRRLADLGYADPAAALRIVQAWQGHTKGGLRAFEARRKAAELAPRLLVAFGEAGDPDHALIGFDRILTRHAQPVELLTVLLGHREIIALIAAILGAAPRLAELVGARAHVVDALLEPGFAAGLPDRAGLERQLDRSFMLARGFEDVLDRARVFGQERQFLIGARVLSGTLAASEAGEAFADLAEVLVRRLHREVEAQIVAAHGEIAGMRTAVVALGKLGSRAMTAGSDLDLILLYDHDPDETASNGARPLVGSQYFSRFTQRLISALTVPTSEGRLYDVDMRLRPSGRNGPVASHIEGFLAYQSTEAWTWEHMALTRGRVVSASPGFAKDVEAALRAIVTRRRDPSATRKDVVEMRRLIETEKGADGPWDLKLGPGGLIDLEFIAQTMQLLHGADHPEILHPNTMRVLAAATDVGLIPVRHAEPLLRGGALIHALTQVLRMGDGTPFEPATSPQGVRRLLVRASDLPDFKTLEADLSALRAAIRAAFAEIVGKV